MRKKKNGIFYRGAVLLEDRLRVRAFGNGSTGSGLFAQQLQKELAVCNRIYGKGQGTAKFHAYQVKRLQKILVLSVLGGALTCILLLYGFCTDPTVTKLKRPDGYKNSKSYALEAKLGQEALGEIFVEIPGRCLTVEDCKALLEEAENLLPTRILQDNVSLEEVQQDLDLPDLLCKDLVEITWETSDFETVDRNGKVENTALQAPKVVTLTARLVCQEQERIVSFPIRVIPAQLELTEQLSQEMVRMLQEEERTDKVQEWFRLPETFEDLPLHWSLPQETYGLWVPVLTAIGCIGIYTASYQDLRKEEKKREEQLMREYPGFLSRLTMLAGTGMPIRAVFARLAANAEGSGKIVCEEIQRTCREMESGVTQAEAFENFGRRCRLAPYKKCAALLTQNLRRGADGLLETLWQEAENACEERRALARQKGEEAQTKLLLPMMMMLLVVMVLIMVPACFSFAGL